MTNKSTYPIDYAIRRLRQAVELAEIEGDFRPVRLAINDLEESINAENIKLVYEDRDMDELERISEDECGHCETTRSIISTFYPF